MITLNFVKNDWVKEKDGTRLMQVDEYQIVESVTFHNGNPSSPMVKREYNGKVWCTWKNENGAVFTQPFTESDLEAATPGEVIALRQNAPI